MCTNYYCRLKQCMPMYHYKSSTQDCNRFWLPTLQSYFYLKLCLLPVLSKCIYLQKRSCPAKQLVSVPVYVKTGTDFFIIRKMIICVPLPPIRHRGCLARFYISSRIQLSIVRTNHVFSFFVTISIDINWIWADLICSTLALAFAVRARPVRAWQWSQQKMTSSVPASQVIMIC